MGTETPTAGRTLDALVAEQVLGWRVETGRAIPCFSTDIAAAWQLLATFEEASNPIIRRLQLTAFRQTWKCTIREHDPLGMQDPEFSSGEVTTAPLALCVALLRWVQRDAL